MNPPRRTFTNLSVKMQQLKNKKTMKTNKKEVTIETIEKLHDVYSKLDMCLHSVLFNEGNCPEVYLNLQEQFAKSYNNIIIQLAKDYNFNL